jgi:branched-chain amino acid transport system ATP-binding protein
MSSLNIEHITVRYGQVQALHDVSLHVDEGEIVGVLGANGAGKSTLLSAIMGITRVASGNITFDSIVLTDLQPHNICKLRIGYVPEGRRLFTDLTVLENLNIGAFTARNKAAKEEQLRLVFRLFPILQNRRNQPAGTLSGGEQQMLAIGRALMIRPELLLLDEPSLGLAPIIIKEIFVALREINRRGTSILLVEQSAYLALKVSKRAYVFETGNVVLEDTVEKLAADPSMKKSYLGL